MGIEDHTSEIINLYKQSIGLKKIAKTYNSSSDTIKKILIKNNIVINKPPNHKNIKEKTNLIIDLYNKRLSILEIARRIGCSGTIIDKILKNNKIEKNRGKYDHLVPEIIELYSHNLSCKEISKKINIPGEMVRFLLKKNKIKTRKGKFVDRYREIIDLYNSGLHMLDVAKKIGCSGIVVKSVLTNNNIKIRPYAKENNKSWRGGSTPINKFVRNHPINKEWKINCFIESDRKSEISDTDNNIQCHHIYGFKNILQSSMMKHKFLSEDLIKVAIVNDDRFYDKDNSLIIEKEEHEKIEASNRDAHPYWKIWKAFPEFALKKFDFTEEQYLSLNTDGQLNALDTKVSVSTTTNEIRQIIRYEHYLGTIPPYKLILTSQLNGVVAGIAILGHGTNKHIKDGCLELVRLCVPSYVIQPYTIKFLNDCAEYIKSNHQEVKELISFADPNIGHDGAIYRMSGWKKEGYTNPSYCYFDPNINQLKHKSYCRRIKDIDKTEIELAKERGLIKIDLLPKKKYSICLHAQVILV